MLAPDVRARFVLASLARSDRAPSECRIRGPFSRFVYIRVKHRVRYVMKPSAKRDRCRLSLLDRLALSRAPRARGSRVAQSLSLSRRPAARGPPTQTTTRARVYWYTDLLNPSVRTILWHFTVLSINRCVWHRSARDRLTTATAHHFASAGTSRPQHGTYMADRTVHTRVTARSRALETPVDRALPHARLCAQRTAPPGCCPS